MSIYVILKMVTNELKCSTDYVKVDGMPHVVAIGQASAGDGDYLRSNSRTSNLI